MIKGKVEVEQRDGTPSLIAKDDMGGEVTLYRDVKRVDVERLILALEILKYSLD